MGKLGIAAFLAGASSIVAPGLLATQPGPSASPDALRAHVEFLADDMLEGRGTGTPGFDVAALYVAAQFRAAGLEPAIDGGWYQQVPLVERTPTTRPVAQLSAGEARFPLGEQVVANISGEGSQKWTGQAVFGGYGRVDPPAGVDELAGLDVRGKALVLFEALPKGLSPEAARSLPARRLEVASERGAAGLIFLPTAPSDESEWSAIRSDFALPYFNWLRADGTPHTGQALRFSAVLQPAAAASLFTGSTVRFDELQALAARGEDLPAIALGQQVAIEASNSWRRFASPNIIGMVHGGDPALAGECILVTSHLDHLGKDLSTPGEDKVFNGAFDNATGVAALIEVARVTAASPARPMRSVVFAATTAEEVGLVGSDYLAAHPVKGCERTVAVVNLDGGVPMHPLREASAYGGWHSTIGEAFAKVAANRGIEPVSDGLAPTEFFARTDHYSFARRSIPAIYLVIAGGDEQSTAAYRDRYHQPSDDLTLPFDWYAGAQFVQLANDLIGELADAPDSPSWYADSLFALRFAKGQPLAARPRK